MGRKIKNYLLSGKTLLSRLINFVVILFIFFSISILPLFFIYTHGEELEMLLTIEKIIVTVFIIEFSLRIILAKKPHRYIFSRWGLINFLSIIPFFLYRFGITENFPTALLFLRTLRLLEFVKFPKLEEMEQKELRQYEHFNILEGEKLLKVVQKHPIIFLLALALPLFLTSLGVIVIVFFNFNIWALVVGSLFLILSCVFYIKIWLDYRYDVLFITDIRIIVQERELFGTVSDKINYESISVIIPNTQGLFKMIFGFGHITIRTPSDATDIHFTYSPNVKEIAHLISQNRNKIVKENPPPK